jgi:predicted dehydrogenase
MIVPSTIFGANAPSNRITMGCIGTGGQGTRDMNGFLQNDDLQILAVCDVNRGSGGYKSQSQFCGREPAKKIVEDYYAKNSRSGSYSGCDAYGDFRHVIERDDIDAVLIVTPDHWHAIPTIMAARAGKDIYCEKPLSLTVREGRAMVEAVRSNGVVFQTGSHHRSKARMRFACELVQNGRIGKVKRFTTVLGPHPLRRDIMDWKPMPVPEGFDYDFWLGPAPLAPYHDARCLYNFRFIMDYAGGETTNTGAHAFDIVQWANGTQLTGPVEFEDLGSEFPTKGLYTAVSKIHFRAQYANGVELLCLPSGGFKNMTARVEGEEGSIDINWDGIETQPVSLQRSVIGPDEIHLYESKDHYRNFLDCVKSRRDPIAPIEVGHRSASLCHLANIAMFLKTKLKWDPIAERVTNNEEANLLLGRDMRNPWSL